MHLRILIIFIFSFLFLPTIVLADNPDLPIRDTDYRARYVTQSVPDPVIIEAGTTRDVTFTFENTGSATWQAQGAYLTAYTVDTKYRSSAFANSSWIKSSNPAKITTPVAPGQRGTITLSLTAPETLGDYTEEFHLAADNYTWVDNGYFYVKIRVVPRTTPIVTETVIEDNTIAAEEPAEESEPEVFVEEELVRTAFISKRNLVERGGTEERIRIALRNISEETIENVRVVPVTSSDAMFAHDSWESAEIIAEVGDLVAGELLRHDVYVYTPAKKGNYRFRVALATDGGILSGSEFTILTEVIAPAPYSFDPPRFATAAVPTAYRFETEPTIRVGLAKIETGSMTFVSEDDTYHLVDDGEVVLELDAGEVATLSYAGGVYRYSDSDGFTHQSLNYLRLEPANDTTARFTLGGGFDRTVTWKGRSDFDTYRGAVELRMADVTPATLYAINELPMETYVAGVAEVSNSAPKEFLKAMSVLSRTYAHYIQGTSKHDKRFFDVVAHTGDQLYLGANIEETTPLYIEAAAATRGEMVTYQNNIVITPYFGNSDGTTRAFHDVWGGAVRPWLISVDAEYDLGRRRFGHGVGMSQRDAMARAEEAGATYSELIKHYYTGVELEQMYK